VFEKHSNTTANKGGGGLTGRGLQGMKRSGETTILLLNSLASEKTLGKNLW